MRAIEHSVEQEPLVKKSKMVDDNIDKVPLLSQNQTSVVDVKTETCVEIENVEVCETVVEEEKDLCVVEQFGSCEGEKIEEVSALSLADRKHIDLKESQDLVMEEKEVVDAVSGDAEMVKPTLDVASGDDVPAIDSCVVAGGIEEEIVSNPSPKKKLIVLDLNGLLADIVSLPVEYKADINIGRRAIFKRPFCEDFLKFCFDKFDVGIWSSRKQNNVERITDFLLGDMKNKLLFCWDMSYCATTTVGSLENRHKFVVFKDLNKLWEKHEPKLPWKLGAYNETNTVLLDDSPYKALLNPPYTAIFPHSYNHQNKTDTSLSESGDLRLHLEKLVEAENVQEFIKKNPFGQEAITEASESWEFYRQAIRLHTLALKKLIR
ncbi:unnamed protein product [Cochlearia groenlandica]